MQNPVVADSAGRFSDIFLGDVPIRWCSAQSASRGAMDRRSGLFAEQRLGARLRSSHGWRHGDAITLAYTRPPIALTAGLKLPFKATAANTAATQINVNGLGLKNIFRQSGPLWWR